MPCRRIFPQLRACLPRVFRDSRGATAIEYGLIVALIVIAMIVALKNLAGTTIGMWNNVSTKVDQAS
jgi:pilus assembly protein Flp/PilA